MDIKKFLFKTNSFDAEKALPDAIIFCNKDGKIQWVNDKAAEIFETSKMHLLTSNIADFIENAQNLIINASIREQEVITKLILKEIYYKLTAKEIEEGFVLAFRDAENAKSEYKNFKNETTLYDIPDKNNLLLKLANDFKSPLQSIIGFSQAMADGLGGNMTEQQEKYINIIRKNSTELMYFINKLMELTQTEISIKNAELKVFDIVNLINSIVRFNEQLNKDKDIRWNINTEEGLRNTIISDEEILRTVIQNILEVILKGIDMGEIQINLSKPSDELIQSKDIFGSNFIMLSISSNSLLLSENELEFIFDPYTIVDSPNRKNILRAMTLACVKNLVEALNGVIWLESRLLKNTTFNIIISQGDTEKANQ